MWAGDCSCPLATYRTSRPRRARKAPSSMQLIWFLSSCLREKAAGALLGQRRAAGWLPVLPTAQPTPNASVPACARPCCHSQVLEVGGPTESFPGDGLDEVLAQVPAGERQEGK